MANDPAIRSGWPACTQARLLLVELVGLLFRVIAEAVEGDPAAGRAVEALERSPNDRPG